MYPMRGYKLLLCCESSIEERSAGNPHATFCGNRRRVTASGDPVCALQAHEVQRSEMIAPAKPSQQPGTESCVVFGSSTYYGADLNALSMGYLFARDAAVRQDLATALGIFWKDIAACVFHPRCHSDI